MRKLWLVIFVDVQITAPKAARSVLTQHNDLPAGGSFVQHDGESAQDKAAREATMEVARAEENQAAVTENARLETMRIKAETWVGLMRAKRAKKKL